MSSESGGRDLFDVSCGVSEGGVLSPTLFNFGVISVTRKLPTNQASIYADVSSLPRLELRRYR